MLRDCVAEVLAQLSPREERILRMRFGIGMPDHTLEQVGKTFGVTRERIRQIEAKALQKLGHPARAGKLVSFWKADRRRGQAALLNARHLGLEPTALEIPDGGLPQRDPLPPNRRT